MRHFSDMELQDYLDGNVGVEEKEFADHLASCRLCRHKLEQYRILYDSLEHDTVPALSPDFAQSVLAKIPDQSFEKSRTSLWQVLIAVGEAICTLGLIIYFVDLKLILNAMKLGFGVEYFEKIVTTGKDNIFTIFGIDPLMVVSVALVLLVTAVADRIIRHSRRKPISFLV